MKNTVKFSLHKISSFLVIFFNFSKKVIKNILPDFVPEILCASTYGYKKM